MFVFSNLAISLDGKIATQERSLLPLGSQNDWREMQKLRQQCDALLIGATTLRGFRKPCLPLRVGRSHQRTRQLPNPINIVMSSTLERLSPKWEFFASSQVNRILLVGHLTPLTRIRRFSKSCEIIVLKPPSGKIPLAVQILTHLEARGIKKLLIEGGGDVMWNFVESNLIDEYHVTLTPKIIGGRQAPTLVDGNGFSFSQILNLKLRKCRILKDELYLIYQRTSQRGIIRR